MHINEIKKKKKKKLKMELEEKTLEDITKKVFMIEK